MRVSSHVTHIRVQLNLAEWNELEKRIQDFLLRKGRLHWHEGQKYYFLFDKPVWPTVRSCFPQLATKTAIA